MKRRSLLLTAPQQMEWVEETLPDVQADEILVKTVAGGISIGTELALYRGDHRGSEAVTYPLMTGYESVGQIIQMGEAASSFSIGQRVIGFYGHRTHAILPASRAIPVPDAVSNELAILAILSCDVTKGINKILPQVDERVLITGCGTIGLLTLFNLKARGIQNVDVVEPLQNRREVALHLGARHAYSPDEHIEGEYAVGFECSSRDAAFTLLQQAVQANGRVCILADGNIEPLTLSSHFHEKELTIMASSDGMDYPGHAAWFFQVTASSHITTLFEHTIISDHLPSTFETLRTDEINPIKVFVKYS